MKGKKTWGGTLWWEKANTAKMGERVKKRKDTVFFSGYGRTDTSIAEINRARQKEAQGGGAVSAPEKRDRGLFGGGWSLAGGGLDQVTHPCRRDQGEGKKQSQAAKEGTIGERST